MKILGLFLLLSVGFGFETSAYDSGIALMTEKGMNMQVYVNGKLYNKNPGKFVRVRSTPGLFHVEVHIMDPQSKKWFIAKKDIRAQKGFELQYKVVFVNSRPQLVELKKYPIYSRYFLHPNLYNKHPVS
jgi:hypothetical protein